MARGALTALLLALAWGQASAKKKKKDPHSMGMTPAGKAFMQENKKREGVETLKSGLQYKVLTAGKGKSHPVKESEVEQHYRATTLTLEPDVLTKDPSEWKTHDSSYEKNRTGIYLPKTAVKGWNQAMRLMVKGDIWEIYVPSTLAYGDAGEAKFGIGWGEMIIMRIEIIDIQGKKQTIKVCNAQTREYCKDNEIAILDKWGKASADEVAAHLKALQSKKETSTILRGGEREQVLKDIKLVKQIVKARKHGEEL